MEDKKQLTATQIEELISILKPIVEANCDTLVLGCTHYPFAKAALKKEVGVDTPILDGSCGTVKSLKKRLAQ